METKAKKLTANQTKNLVNNTKAIYRLGGFETGKRTNLNKAFSYCYSDFKELEKGFNNADFYLKERYNKEYQLENKVRFTNVFSSYEIWFEENKCYLLEMNETKYLIIVGLGYCNVYRLIEKTEKEIFEKQPAITDNGDSKKAVLNYNDNKKIKLTCTLSNTKVCKWDAKYPQSHNHYIVKFQFGGNSACFDWFDSLYNFKTNQIDKTEIDIFGMFYAFLMEGQLAEFSFRDFQENVGSGNESYNACKKSLQKFEKVFAAFGVDLQDFINYMQEEYDF